MFFCVMEQNPVEHEVDEIGVAEDMSSAVIQKKVLGANDLTRVRQPPYG